MSVAPPATPPLTPSLPHCAAAIKNMARSSAFLRFNCPPTGEGHSLPPFPLLRSFGFPALPFTQRQQPTANNQQPSAWNRSLRRGIYSCGVFHAFFFPVGLKEYPVSSESQFFARYFYIFFGGKNVQNWRFPSRSHSLTRLSMRPTSNRVGNFAGATAKRNSRRFRRQRRRRKSGKKFAAAAAPPLVYLHFTIHPRTLHFSEESASRRAALSPSLRVQVLLSDSLSLSQGYFHSHFSLPLSCLPFSPFAVSLLAGCIFGRLYA